MKLEGRVPVGLRRGRRPRGRRRASDLRGGRRVHVGFERWEEGECGI